MRYVVTIFGLHLLACSPDAVLGDDGSGGSGAMMAGAGGGGAGPGGGGSGGGGVPLTGEPIWARSIGGPGHQEARALCVPGDDRVFVGGLVDGDVALPLGGSRAFSGDGLLTVFNGAGVATQQQAFIADSASPPVYLSALTASAGTVYLAGEFAGNLEWPAGAPPTIGISTDTTVFVAALTTDGDPIGAMPPIWAFGATQGTRAGDIEVSSAGEVFVCGTYEGDLTVGTDVLMNATGTRNFVAKFDGTGTGLWAWDLGEYPLASRCKMVLQGTSVHVWTSFMGSFTLDDGSGSPPTAAATSASAALVTISGQGLPIRIVHVDGRREELAFDIARFPNTTCPEAECDLVVVGNFNGSIDFPGHDSLMEGGLYDVFIARLAPDGTTRWAQSFGDLESQGAEGVAIDQRGHIVLTGINTGTITFGGVVLASASSAFDVFVAKLDGDGNPLWSAGYGDENIDRSHELALDNNGNPFVAGNFAGQLTIGDTLDSGLATEFDMFVTKLAP